MKKIFLVEDDKNLSILIQKKLERAGYTVTSVPDGRDIPALLKKEKPGLVLLDIGLPYRNGLDVLEDLRKDDEVKDMPVVVISNSGNPVDIFRIKRLGVTDYLIKVDFDLDELMDIVTRYVPGG
jgi:two-component system, OmpR family, alkaline phosphatase synthesis response regulator PhoP